MRCAGGAAAEAFPRERALCALIGDCVYVAAVQVVRANGLEIAYERTGEGPPLVFVHGAAVDGRMREPQLTALSGEFTVVAWDEPGAGRSSDVPAHFVLADYASAWRR